MQEAMQILIQGAELYSPAKEGKQDVLIAGSKIIAIEEYIDPARLVGKVEVLNGAGKLLTPGFIDTHQHFTGGGGEGSFKTRVPELTLSQQTKNGVTTALGLLGTDSLTRSVEALYAKTMGFREEGLNAYMITGSYFLPSVTITDSVMKDIAFLEPVLGVKLAVSDHRGPYTSWEDIARLAADVRVSSLVAGKAGIITVHTGIGKRRLDQIFEVIKNSDQQAQRFVPTHINRADICEDALRLAEKGAIIDGTAIALADKERLKKRGLSCAKLCEMARDRGLLSQLTISSDAGGSLPRWNEERTKIVGMGVGEPSSLLDEIRRGLAECSLELEELLQPFTVNGARQLGLENRKGRVEPGYDADVLLLDESSLNVRENIIMGRIMVQDGKSRVKGTFE